MTPSAREAVSDVMLSATIARYKRYQILDLEIHRTPEAIQNLERAGFHWLGTRALYHPNHWTPAAIPLADVVFHGAGIDHGLMALSVDAKMAANNGEAVK